MYKNNKHYSLSFIFKGLKGNNGYIKIIRNTKKNCKAIGHFRE